MQWLCGLLGGVLVLTAVSCRHVAARNDFDVTTDDHGSGLNPDGIYPYGRKLAFMGCSGNPARDLTNGFTVAGPVYGNQTPYLEACFQNGWPVIAQIGPHIKFDDKSPNKYKLDEPSLRLEIERQVRELAGHKEIVWWSIRSEELRPWRKEEMQYLRILCDTIRQNDPLARPIFLYNPNNRDAHSLLPIVKYVDIVGKGCYVNYSGHKRERAWVRWTVEQEVEAIRMAGRTNAIPILMPQLSRDPDPSEDNEIRNWVRHDIYLGMSSGAKGVFIYSLFKRAKVRRTWQLWYDAYNECARELNGDRGLAQVFLFGERRASLKVELIQGTAEINVHLGGSTEATTTSDQERAQRIVALPAWTSTEFVYGDSHWLFIINSANSPAALTVIGWPPNARAANAFDGTAINLINKQLLQISLSAYGVAAVRFTPRLALEKSVVRNSSAVKNNTKGGQHEQW